MKPHLRWLLLLAALSTSRVAAQTDESILTGSYAVSGATLVDPPPEEPRDTHLRLHLTGAAARDLFAALKTEAEYDACLDDGSHRKRLGGTVCTRDPAGRTFECSLSIELSTQTVLPGAAC